MDRTPLQQNILVFIGEKIHIYSLEDGITKTSSSLECIFKLFNHRQITKHFDCYLYIYDMSFFFKYLLFLPMI